MNGAAGLASRYVRLDERGATPHQENVSARGVYNGKVRMSTVIIYILLHPQIACRHLSYQQLVLSTPEFSLHIACGGFRRNG